VDIVFARLFAFRPAFEHYLGVSAGLRAAAADVDNRKVAAAEHALEFHPREKSEHVVGFSRRDVGAKVMIVAS
jgi:hypothetical protein